MLAGLPLQLVESQLRQRDLAKHMSQENNSQAKAWRRHSKRHDSGYNSSDEDGGVSLLVLRDCSYQG